MMGNRRRSDSKKGSYWTRFTTLEKCQFLAVLVLLIILLIVIFTHSSGKTDDICQTPSCVKAAYNVLSRIDVDVDPCEDFYNYTCGKFLNETFLPDYESSVDSFSIVSDSVGEQVKTLLEKPVINEDPHHIKLVKNFYKACMNVTSINENSLNELKNIFEKVGGWPVVKGDQWVQVDWVNVYYRFQEFGFQNEVFLLVNVEPDFMNSSRNLISLDQPYISYKEEMLKGFNDPTVAEYVQYSIQLAKILGADQTRAVDEMTKVVKLHQALAEIAIPEEERRDFFKEYNLKTILQLQNEYPYIPWLNFMNNIVSPSKKRTYNDSILVTVPAYFEKLGHVLNDHGPRTVVNYLFWVALRESTTYLGDNVKNLKLQYKRLSFVQTTQPRWKECSYEANNNLNIAVGSLYIKSFFKEINRQTMIDIVDNIKNEFTETLSTINWMDEATKNEAIQKVQAMTKHIGYPDELLDDTKVSEYYEDLIINPDSYLSCGLGLNKFFSTKSLERLDEVIDKNDWTKHAAAAETNAFYDQNENSIQFPAGILQGVFFDGERPLYMNYGAIGFIVGHEITHGFDDRGRQYDKDGNLRDWWPNKTVEAFTEKAKCIQEQYGKIPVPGTNSYINVINTQGENIADNGGIKHAYLAYKKLVSKMGPERLLPGLSQYTPEQLFWISSGNLWCAKVRTEQITKDLDQQEHAPTYFRVNVPLMNNEDFAKDFNCAVGTRMNPPKKEKCIVWDFLKKRTILEKILVLYILLTVVIFIYMAVNFHAKTPLANQLKSNRSDLCLTAVCVRNAANILRKIDNAVDPCYDFYKFACGRFTREETIPEEAMEVSPFTEIGQRIELQFKSFLETDYKNDPHYVELMKTIYKTCMNSTQIEINGLRRIKRIFAEAGGWPMMLQPNQWNARNFNWKSLVYFFKKKGLPHDMFFSLYVNNDYVNTTLKKIMLGKPWVDSEFFSGGFNNTQIQQYYDYMVDVGATFGVNRQKAQIEMKQVLEFIINLAKIMVVHDKVNLTSKYHPMTIRELQKEFATIPWLQYVNVMLAPVDSISWDDVVIVQYPKFLSDLENLLFKTQKQILANYMYWSAFEYEIPFLTKDLNNIQFEYRRKLFGVGQKLPRWQNCVRQSMRLNLAAGLIFTTNFFNDKSIRAVTNLVEDVKLAFLDTVRSNNWMDKKTKRHAITKAERLTAFVEYPQDLKNEEVDEYYKSLTLTTNDFLEIDLNLTIFEHHKSVEELRQSKSKNDWKSLAAFSRSLSVSYNRQQNTLKIRPAVLQDPFYDSDRPQYMNYGALGYWIGHEITHGFDNSGRQYDKDGNLIDWWEPISNQTFNKKAQCIVEQFRNYSIPEINVNLDAEKTKSENIADNAGIRIAYNAYQKFLAKNGEEPSLPGLPYTPKQMFWISAATNFCTKYRKEWLTQVLRIYPNPPNYLRVVLPFMNSRFFAKDYQCPLLSPMNPKYKCQVW